MTWRVANSLLELRGQVNENCPKRDKSSDGSIGDEAHASRSSDHNPWVKDSSGVGVVTAIDLTHDPKGGFDSYKFAEYLRTKKDRRIKYVISNGRIFNSSVDAWQWRKYSGANKHDHHVHISVSENPNLYDDPAAWDLEAFGFAPVKNAPVASTDPVISKGARGPAVEELQCLLKLPVDGHFGPDTDSAVRLFQKVQGLFEDGVVGTYTWEKLRAKSQKGK